MCYNRPPRYSLRLVGHTFICYCHALFGSFCHNSQHINVSYWHCTYKTFYKCTARATKHALHLIFTYVHEKVILLRRNRLRALVVLVFRHDMEIQVAHALCKHGCRLISYTDNKRFVAIEACYNCPRSPLHFINNMPESFWDNYIWCIAKMIV